jgi:hypothetical protein
VAHHMVQNMRPGDLIVCGQHPKTPCDFDLTVRTHTDVQEFDKLVFETLKRNRAYAARPGRVWMAMPHLTQQQTVALPHELPPDHYWLAGSPDYGRVGWVLLDAQSTVGDNLAAAMQLGVTLSLDVEHRYQYYLSLAQIRLTQGQLTAAEEAYAGASRLASDVIVSDERLKLVAEQLEYARQAARAADALPPGARPVQLDMEGLARLIGYEVSHETLSPGDSLTVTLYWQPLARITGELVSYVHLTDLAANLLGETSGIPADGQAPTHTWQLGQTVVDRHALTVNATAPAPLVLNVEAGLFDPTKKQSLGAIGMAGRPVSSTIAQVKVIPRSWPVVKPTYVRDASFGDVISLVGYDLISEPPGIVLYWRAQATMHEEYTVFVHLLDSTGQLAGQIDGPPLGGNYPTSWWSPGDVIADRRSAPAVASGDYQLLVGWYQLSDGSRLPLADGSGDSLTLGSVSIP